MEKDVVFLDGNDVNFFWKGQVSPRQALSELEGATGAQVTQTVSCTDAQSRPGAGLQERTPHPSAGAA